MRYSRETVLGILSQDHLRNTAKNYGIQPNEVTAEQLIAHWEAFHTPDIEVVMFEVEARLNHEDDKNEHMFV